jgi:predicted GNAT family acetyltransferase
MSQSSVVHHPENSCFTLTQNGRESVVRYLESPGTLDIVSTVVHPADRGHGVAAQLTQAALGYANSKNLAVIPSCSYAAAYLARHSK